MDQKAEKEQAEREREQAINAEKAIEEHAEKEKKERKVKFKSSKNPLSL